MADILLILKHTMSILQRAGERTLTWPQYSFCRVYSGKVPKISEVYPYIFREQWSLQS